MSRTPNYPNILNCKVAAAKYLYLRCLNTSHLIKYKQSYFLKLVGVGCLFLTLCVMMMILLQSGSTELNCSVCSRCLGGVGQSGHKHGGQVVERGQK